jgi:hypothetical protein
MIQATEEKWGNRRSVGSFRRDLAQLLNGAEPEGERRDPNQNHLT